MCIAWLDCIGGLSGATTGLSGAADQSWRLVKTENGTKCILGDEMAQAPDGCHWQRQRWRLQQVFLHRMPVQATCPWPPSRVQRVRSWTTECNRHVRWPSCRYKEHLLQKLCWTLPRQPWQFLRLHSGPTTETTRMRAQRWAFTLAVTAFWPFGTCGGPAVATRNTCCRTSAGHCPDSGGGF